MSDVVLSASSVSKKFCREFRRGMIYSAVDTLRDTIGITPGEPRLRAGEMWSLKDVSFELKAGQCLGLLGANGAGKSTLLKLINGIFKPDGGELRVRGRVGALIEVGAGFHPMLTGRENIYVNGTILGMKKAEIDRRLDEIIDFSGLDSAALDAPIRTYSSGMYVRLGFSVAIHCKVDLLLVDEVLAVGDMNFQAKCLNAMGQIRKTGTTVVLVSHALNHIAGWADCALALDRGEVLAFGDPQSTIQRYADHMTKSAAAAKPARKIAGSGRARFATVTMLNSAGVAATKLTAGEPFSIAIEIDANEPIEGAELDLKLYDGSTRLLSGGSTRYTDSELKLPIGRTTLRATYPAIPVNGGHLRPSLALWAKGRSEVLDWFEGEALPVTGIAASEGELQWFPTYTTSSTETGSAR